MDVGKIDVVQVELTRCGGCTEAMKIASLAWDRGLPVANHGFTTYINVAAALHWLNPIPNALICEFVAETGTTLRELITKQRLKAEEGYVSVPQEPGLGIDLSMTMRLPHTASARTLPLRICLEITYPL
jgi:L-rhamnonate dehydratase